MVNVTSKVLVAGQVGARVGQALEALINFCKLKYGVRFCFPLVPPTCVTFFSMNFTTCNRLFSPSSKCCGIKIRDGLIQRTLFKLLITSKVVKRFYFVALNTFEFTKRIRQQRIKISSLTFRQTQTLIVYLIWLSFWGQLYKAQAERIKEAISYVRENMLIEEAHALWKTVEAYKW